GIRELFRRSQFLLPLEAPTRGQKVRGLYAGPRPQSPLRRTRELHPAGRQRQIEWRIEIGMGKLAVSCQLSVISKTYLRRFSKNSIAFKPISPGKSFRSAFPL